MSLFNIQPGATPQEVARNREIIASMMPRFGRAQYTGEGLGHLGTGFALGRAHRQAGRAEREGRAGAQSLFDRITGGASGDANGFSILGQGSGASTTPAPSGGSNSSSGGFLRNLFRGQSEQDPQEGDPRRGQFPTGAGAANDPAQYTTAFEFGMGEDLRPSQEWTHVIGDSVEAVLGPGARVAVSSGHRPGDHGSQHSTRHAGDFAIYTADGQQLSWDSPEARAIAAEAASRGARGFGAGPNYMGGNYLHFDLGLGGEHASARPGVQVWSDDDGNGNSSGGPGAAQWMQDLQTAASGGTPVIDRSSTPQYTSGGGGGGGSAPMSELYAALANPWLDANQRGVIESMIATQQRNSDPLRQLQIATAQERLSQMRNPTPEPGFRLTTPEEAAQYGGMGQVGPNGRFYPLDTANGPGLEIQELADGRQYYIDPTGQQEPRLVAPNLEVPAGAEISENLEQFRREFNQHPTVRAFGSQSQAYGRIVASAQDPSAAGDLALIFNYMKLLDPGSVVREGEFATAQNAAGIPERIRAVYNQALSGERLAPQTRDDFVDRANRLYTTAEEHFGSLYGQYSGIAERRGWDLSDALIDLRYTGEGLAPSATPQTGSPAQPSMSEGAFSQMSVQELLAVPQEQLNTVELLQAWTRRLEELGNE